MKTINFIIILLLAGFFIPNILYSDELEITDTDAASGQDDEDVIIITGEPEVEIEPISPVSEITGEEIERRGITNLEEALDIEPGIRLRTQCNICNSREVRMRGLSGRHNLILFNNNPVLSELALNYVLSIFPTSTIENIEIIKGPGYARFGGKAMSGVININISEPDPEKIYEINTRGQVSSEFGYLTNLAGSIAFQNFAWMTAFQRDFAQSTDPDNDDLTNSPEFTNNALINYFWAEAGVFDITGYVGYFYEKRFGGDLKEELYLKWGLENLGGYYENILTSRVEGSIDVKYMISKPSYVKLFISSSYHDQDSELSFKHYTANQKQLNIDLEHYQLIGEYCIIESGFQFKMDDVILSYELYEKLRYLYGLFASCETAILYPVIIRAGLRYDYSGTFGQEISPRLEGLYEINENLAVKLSYGHGFVVPTIFFAQTHFPPGGTYIIETDENISAEISDSINLNLSYEWFLIEAKIDLYFIWVDDLIMGVPSGIDNTTSKLIILYQNIGRAYSTGIEAEINISFSNITETFLKYFFVSMAYTCDEARDYDNNEKIAFHPVHLFNTELVFEQPDWGSTISVQAEITGRMRTISVERYSDDTEATIEGTSPYYTILNFHVSQFLWQKYIKIFFGIKNIFDFRQTLWSKDNQYVWGPTIGRVYYGGVTISF